MFLIALHSKLDLIQLDIRVSILDIVPIYPSIKVVKTEPAIPYGIFDLNVLFCWPLTDRVGERRHEVRDEAVHDCCIVAVDLKHHARAHSSVPVARLILGEDVLRAGCICQQDDGDEDSQNLKMDHFYKMLT